MVGGGIQYHSMLYTKSVESLLAAYPGDAMEDGDSFVCNDPYQAGNSHVPDMVVATPVFYQGQRIAFGVSVAHKADVGGLVPGSSGAASREIFHDGLRLPPVRYWTSVAWFPKSRTSFVPTAGCRTSWWAICVDRWGQRAWGPSG